MIRKPSKWVARLDQIFYPGYEDRWDDELFSRVIGERLQPEFEVIDVGAGAGIVTQMNFRGRVKRIVGVDPDPRVAENPTLDEGHVGRGEAIPYPDESFDLAFSDHVLEHVENPRALFREVWRVLKPGGRYLFKTPNRRHYVPLVARLTPLSFHQLVNRLRGLDDEDSFPTLYRVNTPEDIRAVAAETGFVVEKIDLLDGRPEYMRISAPTYVLGWMAERANHHIPALARFRPGIIAALQKPARPSA